MYHSVDILTVFTASSALLNDCRSFPITAESVESSRGLYGKVLENVLTHQQAFWPLLWAGSQSKVKLP